MPQARNSREKPSPDFFGGKARVPQEFQSKSRLDFLFSSEFQHGFLSASFLSRCPVLSDRAAVRVVLHSMGTAAAVRVQS